MKTSKRAEPLRVLAPLVRDSRVGPVHLCVFLALVLSKRGTGSFDVQRREVSRLAKIKGKGTYYRVMKDLAEWGYIGYWPRKGREGSEVEVRMMQC